MCAWNLPELLNTPYSIFLLWQLPFQENVYIYIYNSLPPHPTYTHVCSDDLSFFLSLSLCIACTYVHWRPDWSLPHSHALSIGWRYLFCFWIDIRICLIVIGCLIIHWFWGDNHWWTQKSVSYSHLISIAADLYLDRLWLRLLLLLFYWWEARALLVTKHTSSSHLPMQSHRTILGELLQTLQATMHLPGAIIDLCHLITLSQWGGMCTYISNSQHWFIIHTLKREKMDRWHSQHLVYQSGHQTKTCMCKRRGKKHCFVVQDVLVDWARAL